MRTRNPVSAAAPAFSGTRWLVRAAALLACAACSPERRLLTESHGPEALSVRQFGSLTVLTKTTGEDLDLDGYSVSLDGANGATETPIGLDATITLSGITAGPRTVRLGGISPNCRVVHDAVSGGEERAVVISSSGASVAFTVVCERRPDGPGNSAALSGTWTAVRWEFFPLPGTTLPWNRTSDDVIAGGVTGTLTVTASGESEVSWRWREWYRWWGPDRPTTFEGRAVVGAGSLVASVGRVQSEFECDMGDCDGPLHGAHAFQRTGDTLVITHVGSIGYYAVIGPSPASTKLTLVRAP